MQSNDPTTPLPNNTNVYAEFAPRSTAACDICRGNKIELRELKVVKLFPFQITLNSGAKVDLEKGWWRSYHFDCFWRKTGNLQSHTLRESGKDDSGEAYLLGLRKMEENGWL